MQVFRVEHSQGGFGPYNAKMHALNEYLYAKLSDTDQADDIMLDYMNVIHTSKPDTQPPPQVDREMSPHFYYYLWGDNPAKADWHFGFGSIEQLNNWFSESDRLTLSLLGYVVSVYEIDIDDVFMSPYQALFHRPSANLVETLKKF